MATFLFDKTIFGPVHSRRLGISLGVNLLPNDRKLCSFDCLYCECGFGQTAGPSAKLPTRNEVSGMLKTKLEEMRANGEMPDVITFAGNGEPTLHPAFAEIIDDTLALRDEYCPKARVAVLSNASRLRDKNVVAALKKIDDNILKLDSASDEIVKTLDRPNYKYSVSEAVELIAQFHDNLAVQTMFTRWSIDGIQYDNSTDESVEEWLKLIEKINPPRIMIYTIDRDTPLKSMEKVGRERLDEIAQKARKICDNVSVSY